MNENVINSYQLTSLDITTVIAIICGILVIVSKNPIVSVLYLIGLFLSVALILILHGINFLGLAYILVYVGAVSILFLFILMLINVRISEIVSATSNSIPLAIAVGTILYISISKGLPNNLNDGVLINSDLTLPLYNAVNNFVIPNNNFFDSVSMPNLIIFPVWDSVLTDFSHINVIGNVIYTVYPMWLILTSLVLLLAMVGTIIITIKA